ncbi:MAG: acyltransferase [Patescibacteria group bacterium]
MTDENRHILHEVEALRGVAILAVMAIHTTNPYTVLAGMSVLGVILMIANKIAGFAVPLFIFLSGFVLWARYGNFFNLRWFYKKRARAILPVYVFATVFYTIALYFVNAKHFTAGTFLIDFLIGNTSYHLWFFILIMQFYLFYPILSRIFARATQRRGGVLGLLGTTFAIQCFWQFAIYGLATAMHGRAGELITLVLSRTVLSFIFYFFLGMFFKHSVSKVIQRITIFWRWCLALVAGSVTAVIVLATVLPSHSTGIRTFYSPVQWSVNTVGQVILNLCMIVLLYALVQQWAQTKKYFLRILEKLGAASLGMYVLHVLLQIILVKMLRQWGWLPDMWYVYPVLFVSNVIVSYYVVSLLGRFQFFRLLGIGAKIP